ncbi:MAG: asparaginase domain-containing protein [Candidatus Gracilibacteria bacterium]|jgi:L-asparaginase
MEKKKEAIHFVATGGTIDSFYNGIKDTATPRKESIIPAYLEMLKLYEKVKFTQVCMKDSRELTKADLQKILKTVEKSPYSKIIITHGTYTMPDTARFLKNNLKKKNQTIILTGSMIPLEGFSPSDGGFALGYAIAQIQILPAGIYVCMNGKVFNPDEVVKVLSEGRFSSVFNK